MQMHVTLANTKKDYDVTKGITAIQAPIATLLAHRQRALLTQSEVGWTPIAANGRVAPIGTSPATCDSYSRRITFDVTHSNE